MSRNMFAYVVLAALTCVALTGCDGCEKYNGDNQEAVTVGREDAECMVMICVDLSGSFADRMADDGKAYEFTLRVTDTYFRNSVGTNNRILIGQLSGTDRSLLWDGTPVELRRDFPSAGKFRDFLLKRSNPGGSRIHDGIAEAFDYVLSDPGVAGGKTRTAMFVLSDMIDNLSDPKSEERLAGSLQAFGKTKGVAGFYFLEHGRVPTWRQHLRQSGIRNWVCESEIVAYPTLPTFE